ncbi:hypothetical protein [Haladaptatus sp. CMSO5]|uniref:hypothetical protein n=1 Tax=Haladaptatus sp. CMSO5 TaxID=3120514 RepID=UPI002FCE492B
MSLDSPISLPRSLDDSRLRHGLCFLGFLAIYGVLLRGITLGNLYTFGDFAPFFGMDGLRKFTTVWVNQGLGYSYIYHVLPAYLGAITAVGGVLAQNLLFFAFIPVGYLTFLVFGRRFVESIPALHLAAFVYAINPLTIGEFVNGGVAALIGFAFLPLLLHYLYAIVDGDSWEATLKAGAVFGATTVSPWLGFWMVAPFATYLVYRARWSPRTILKLCVSGVLGVILSLPSVHHMLQRALGFDSGQSVLESTFMWNYTEASVLAVVRLAGNHGVMAMNQLGYNDDPAMLIGLVIPGIALLAIRQRRLTVYYAIASLIVSFMVLTKYGFTTPLFEMFPPMWSLRNPVKLQYPLTICMSLLFGAGLDTVLVGPRAEPHPLAQPSRTTRPVLTDGGTPSRANAVVLGVVLLSLVAYAAPAAGALGLQDVRGDDYYVPDEQAELAAQLDGTVMWVPYGYTSQLRLRHTYPDHVGLKSGGIAQGIQNAGYVTTLFEKFARDPEAVRPQLAKQGVKYVVVESDPPGDIDRGQPRVVERWGAPWLWGSSENYDERLAESDGYDIAFETADYTVYRVDGARDVSRFEEYDGLHRLYYPTSRGTVETYGENRIANGDFDDDLDGWWVWSGENGTQSRIIETDDGDHAVEMVTESGDPYPLAQSTTVEADQPYELTVEGAGNATVFLYWYDGSKSQDNLVARESHLLNESATTVLAQGDTLSVRIRPDSPQVTVESVSLERASYPRQTGFTTNGGDIPGVVVDGYDDNQTLGTAVAVNLNNSEADAVGADVVIRDAETVLDEQLVYNESYRQGAGVLLAEEDLETVVPDGATAVTYNHPDGVVLDYWRFGAFDNRSVTVLATSYDDRWVGPADAEHFHAYGWANGYVNAEPDEIRWTGGELRTWVVRIWAGAWLVVLSVLVSNALRKRWRSRKQPDRLGL